MTLCSTRPLLLNSLLGFKKLSVQSQDVFFHGTESAHHVVWLKEHSLCLLSHLLSVPHTGSKQWTLASCNTPALSVSTVWLFLELIAGNVYPPKVEPSDRLKEPLWSNSASRISEFTGLTYRSVDDAKQQYHRDASTQGNRKASKSCKD